MAIYANISGRLVAFAVATCAGVAGAGEPGLLAGSEEAVGSRVSVSAGVDWSSQYFFRGIVQETEGVIVQPWVELGAELYEWEGGSIAANVGIWNSYHDNSTAAASSDDLVRHWYESDMYAGISIESGRWGFGIAYTAYTSPSGAFGTVEEFSLVASYDDAGFWGGFLGEASLAPSVTLAVEVSENAADGAVRGAYLGFGIEPEFAIEDQWFDGMTVSVPVTVGLSVDNYYEDGLGNDDTFGFLQIGVTASVPLGIHVGYGEWSVTGGVQVLFLGDVAETINGGDSIEAGASFGVGVNF